MITLFENLKSHLLHVLKLNFLNTYFCEFVNEIKC